MNLTKKEREEVTKVYDTWLNSYLTGDVETYDSFFDDRYHFIGSTGNEHFLDRRDTTEFFANTGDQFAGKTKIKNNTRTIEKFEGLIFVTEIFDTYFLIEGDWTYYGKFRFTSALQKNKEGWRFIYQHFSTPDTKAEEGETIGTQKIAAENLILKEAVRRRTIELEHKNRELEIEAALERIRARVTAMQESSGLLDIVVIMQAEFTRLGHEAHYFWHMRWLPDKYEKALTNGDGTRIGNVLELPRGFHGLQPMLDWEKSEEPSAVFALDAETAADYIDKMITLGRFQEIDHSAPGPDEVRAMGGLTFVMARTTHGEIGYTLPGEVPNPPEEDIATLVRFAAVFDLAYRRFEDLKSAEQQHRETQIELALERVRAKTMAMRNSHDVGVTVVTLFDEVLKLGLDKSIRVGIGILEGNEGMETWSVNSDPSGDVDLKMGMLDMTIHPMLIGLKKAWRSGKTCYSYDYIGDDVFRYYQALNNEPEYPFRADLNTLPENEYHRSFFFPEGILFSFAPNPISDEAAKVLDRFARVFGQTYRRYRDLLKAEGQAREAQIEAALERVRSKAMAMHSSEDLAETVDTFFSELTALNVTPHRCGMGIIDPETRIVDIQSTTSTHTNEIKTVSGQLKLSGHPVLDSIFENWKLQKEYHPVLHGNEISEYYKVMNPQVNFPDFAEDEVQYGYYFYFKEGGAYAWTDKELDEQDLQIFRRYTSVLSLTYRRYMDLKEAEVQAREAIKQSSLDRVRGKIASMRSPGDLDHITPLIWSELEILDVPFIRCGVFIIDETRSSVQVHLTTPDGKPIGALNFPIDANELTRNTVEYWRKKKVYTIHWNKEDFVNWMQSMINLGQIQTPEQYQGYTKPPESLDLHFIPFKQGMLYVGNIEPLLPEKIELVKTLAEAFSIAYARYEDFVHLEEAKTRVEKTLSELKSAQSQLIHAEKMASLGELTAGIAHEIQNPLNFVNNFSEVNLDLINELKAEMKNGDMEEVDALLNDITQNEEKINYHGKRADSIVKGMLQHSRSSNGQKVHTDINALADEYLRLSYHGLRAKDKSFNADFRIEADPSLPDVRVVPQDIGRVLLNLFNNAFFSVSEKNKQPDNGYKPEVIVRTKKLGKMIEIRVKDNGTGIPEDIRHKIFQPFFTTKPTGEGTGLGLSMSYDIITKGHGGKLKVESQAGEGTEFIISIPIEK
jgi:signal transduction histidine kinase